MSSPSFRLALCLLPAGVAQQAKLQVSQFSFRGMNMINCPKIGSKNENRKCKQTTQCSHAGWLACYYS